MTEQNLTESLYSQVVVLVLLKFPISLSLSLCFQITSLTQHQPSSKLLVNEHNRCNTTIMFVDQRAAILGRLKQFLINRPEQSQQSYRSILGRSEAVIVKIISFSHAFYGSRVKITHPNECGNCLWVWPTLNNASDYRTNGLHRTPNPNPGCGQNHATRHRTKCHYIC